MEKRKSFSRERVFYLLFDNETLSSNYCYYPLCLCILNPEIRAFRIPQKSFPGSTPNLQFDIRIFFNKFIPD
jgi:hypothetical protein